MTSVAVSVRQVRKVYGAITALDGISFDVASGSIFGLLGPNGAGKTTLLRILTTLTRTTAGEALVDGFSVSSAGREVRRRIGVVPQVNNLDRYLTARENLVYHARMYGMAPADYNRRIDELLELTELAPRQHDMPDTFSGGMQRRLVVARALVHEPRVLFLDEPTTGLDPQSRRALWEYIRTFRSTMTIFLTTHYLEEADALCDRIIIMDQGRTLADGSSGELKRRYAHDHQLEMEFIRGSEEYATRISSLAEVREVNRNGNLLRATLAQDNGLPAVLAAVA
ncbi:MAG TPA: ATP-binding cassette domain-containing protein, partial [Geobacterales bacterium]|nr:ATP-binding cassette domain-containing protein [Geobacterales bacterium]